MLPASKLQGGIPNSLRKTPNFATTYAFVEFPDLSSALFSILFNPSSQNIFIVDDDSAVRESISLLVAMNGYRPTSFDSAEVFFSEISSNWRGCVLADLRMPGMGGLELQMTLQRKKSPLSVILMSGLPNVAAARLAFKAGAIDFLTKPLSEIELLSAIRTAFKHR